MSEPVTSNDFFPGSGGLFEAGCEAAKLLELGEAAFDQMALGIEVLVEQIFERA
jgi:hypothetical protein